MVMDILLILSLALVPALLHICLITIFLRRVATALQRSADTPPFNTVVVVTSLGPNLRAVTRLLERATRLDLEEIDDFVAVGSGRLPLPMSQPAAWQLVQRLRNVGASAELEAVVQLQ
jgi:hypothetical protein